MPNSEKNSSLESDQKSAQQISEEAFAENEVLLQQLENLKGKKDYIVKYKGVIEKEKVGFQQLPQGEEARIN